MTAASDNAAWLESVLNDAFSSIPGEYVAKMDSTSRDLMRSLCDKAYRAVHAKAPHSELDEQLRYLRSCGFTHERTAGDFDVGVCVTDGIRHGIVSDVDEAAGLLQVKWGKDVSESVVPSAVSRIERMPVSERYEAEYSSAYALDTAKALRSYGIDARCDEDNTIVVDLCARNRMEAEAAALQLKEMHGMPLPKIIRPRRKTMTFGRGAFLPQKFSSKLPSVGEKPSGKIEKYWAEKPKENPVDENSDFPSDVDIAAYRRQAFVETLQKELSSIAGSKLFEAQEMARMISRSTDGIIDKDLTSFLSETRASFTRVYGTEPSMSPESVKTAVERAQVQVPSKEDAAQNIKRGVPFNRPVVLQVKRKSTIDSEARDAKSDNITVNQRDLTALEDVLGAVFSAARVASSNTDSKPSLRRLADSVLRFYNFISVNQDKPWSPIRMKASEGVESDLIANLLTEAEIDEKTDSGKDSFDMERREKIRISFLRPAMAVKKLNGSSASSERIETLMTYIRKVRARIQALRDDPTSVNSVRLLGRMLRSTLAYLLKHPEEPWNTIVTPQMTKATDS